MSITSVGRPTSGNFPATFTPAERRVAETMESVHQKFVAEVINKDDTLRQLYDIAQNANGEHSREEVAAAGVKLSEAVSQLGFRSKAVQDAGSSPSKLLEIAKNIDGKFGHAESVAASQKFSELISQASRGGARGRVAFFEQLSPEQLNRDEYGFQGVLDRARVAVVLEDKLEARVRAGAFTYGDQDPKDAESRLILSLYRQIGVDGSASGNARSKVAVQAVFRYAEEGYSTGLHNDVAKSLRPYGIPFEPQGRSSLNPQDRVTLSADAIQRLSEEAVALKRS